MSGAYEKEKFRYFRRALALVVVRSGVYNTLAHQ